MDINVKLDVFEGPFDLLFHLIEKNKIDIYDIPIGVLTEQYLEYMSVLERKNMDAMSQFLIMAAELLEIKSKMLLPKPSVEEEEDTDPREELVRKLVEYKKFKRAAEIFDSRQDSTGDTVFKKPDKEVIKYLKERQPENIEEILRDIDLGMLYRALEDVIKRQDIKTDRVRSGFNSVSRDLYTIEDKIQYISDLLLLKKEFKFSDAFRKDSAKSEIVVTFLALLELIKIKKICVRQKAIFDEIIISAY